MDFKLMTLQMEVKFLDSIFYYKSFLKSGVIMEFCRLELSTSMSTIEFLSFDLFC